MTKRRHSSENVAEMKRKKENQENSDIEVINEVIGDNDLIKDLNNILKQAPKSGDYSVHGHAKELPSFPGLEIENFGQVGFPLNTCQAESLIKICDQAPFGKGFETLYDKNVRDTYQISADKIKLTNPDWNKGLQELVDRVTDKLGSNGKCEAKLYKLLLYKPGGHFLKHRDTEKEKNMFATLIISLPCEYTGGQLVVYENDNKSKQIIEFENTKYSINFAAHYADLEHELLEVKSGYRVVLTYSICWLREYDANRFKSSLKDYAQISEILSNLKDPEFQVGVLLDHRYTAESFRSRGINALKGIDLDRYNLLKQANELLPSDKKLIFFIVHGNYFIDGYDVSGWGTDGWGHNVDSSYHAGSDSEDSYDLSFDENECEWDTNEETNFISECYDINGRVIFGAHSKKYGFNECISTSNLNFDSFTHIISPTLDNAEIDIDNLQVWGDMKDKKFEGWTGNEGVTMTTIYHKYMIAFMPELQAFNLTIYVDPEHTIKSFFESPKSVTKEYLNILLKSIKIKPISKNSWLRILYILIKFDDLELAKRFLAKIRDLDKEYVPHLAKFINHFGYELLMDSITQIINANKLDLGFNCSLAEKMFNIGMEENSYDYFIKTVVPVINRVDGESLGMKSVIELIRITNIYLKRDKTLEKIVDHLKDFIRKRVELLRQKIGENNTFSWCMPEAKLSSYPDIERFLHSPQETMVYRGLNSIVTARRFVRNYSGIQNGYSCRMVESGQGKYTIVTIYKTKDLFSLKQQRIQGYQQELNKLIPLI